MTVTRWDDDARPEDAYRDATLDELAELRSNVLAAGYSDAVANGVVGLAMCVATGQEPPRSQGSLANYRRVLRELGDAPKPRRRARTRAGQRGAAALQLVGAAASGSALALAAAQTGSVALYGLAAVATPIILDESITSSSGAAERLSRVVELAGVAA